jgi:hypothetical protein
MTIQGGFGPEGAGILNRGTLELHHVTVIGNTAHEGAGGIANLDGGALLLANSTVRENFSHHGPSGGIGNGSLQDSSFSELWIFNSTISGNQVVAGDFSYDAYGGGIINMGLLAIQNSTISENKVLNSDNPAVGGILNLGTGHDDHRGESWLNTVTIAANAGNYREDTTGGVMNIDGNFYYANSIIAGNDEASWKGDCRGYLTTLCGNLVGELGKVQPCRIKAWAGLPATTPIDRVGRTISGPLHWDIFVAPGEGEFKGVNVGRPLLANNGGLTCTHALCGSGMGNCASAQRSLAINAAWQNKPGTFSLACEATDQRGVPRRSCDSGAFEAELNPNPPNSLQCSPIIRLR